MSFVLEKVEGVPPVVGYTKVPQYNAELDAGLGHVVESCLKHPVYDALSAILPTTKALQDGSAKHIAEHSSTASALVVEVVRVPKLFAVTVSLAQYPLPLTATGAGCTLQAVH